MICKNCGTTIEEEGVAFCPNCGASLTDQEKVDIEQKVVVVEDSSESMEKSGKKILTFGLISLIAPIAASVLSIIGILLSLLPFIGVVFSILSGFLGTGSTIASVVFGILGIVNASKHKKAFGSCVGNAKAGKILSIISLSLFAASIVILLLVAISIISMCAIGIIITAITDGQF